MVKTSPKLKFQHDGIWIDLSSEGVWLAPKCFDVTIYYRLPFIHGRHQFRKIRPGPMVKTPPKLNFPHDGIWIAMSIEGVWLAPKCIEVTIHLKLPFIVGRN